MRYNKTLLSKLGKEKIPRRKLLYLSQATLFGLAFLLTNMPLKVHAASAWLSGNPTVTTLDSNTSLPSRANGQSCQQQSILTRKSVNLSTTDQWATQCVGSYPYGFFTNASYLQLTDVAGPLTDYNNRNSLVPIPDSDNVFSVMNGRFAQNYYFNYDVPAHVTKTVGTGTISYKINTAPQNPISDVAG